MSRFYHAAFSKSVGQEFMNNLMGELITAEAPDKDPIFELWYLRVLSRYPAWIDIMNKAMGDDETRELVVSSLGGSDDAEPVEAPVKPVGRKSAMLQQRLQEWLRSHPRVASSIAASEHSGRNKGQVKFVKRRLSELQQRLQERIRNNESVLLSNARWLGRSLGLTPVEQVVLAFMVAYDKSLLGSMFEASESSRMSDFLKFAACALALPPQQIEQALAGEGLLATAGLVNVSTERGMGSTLTIKMMPGMSRALMEKADSLEKILRAFQLPLPASELDASDYSYMGDSFNRLLRLLRGAVENGESGVNIMLYGPPGSGKTQLARLLVDTIGARGYQVAGDKVDGRDIFNIPADRLTLYSVSQHLLRHADKTVVVFDESDRVLTHGNQNIFAVLFGANAESTSEAYDKARLHAQLESNAVPTIWIGNDFSGLPLAALRRFSLLVEMSIPPRPVRRKLLAEAVKELDVSDKWLDEAAMDEKVSPGIIANVAETVDIMSDGGAGEAEKDLDFALGEIRSVRGATGRSTPRHPADLGPFDASMVNTDESLEAIVDSFRRMSDGSLLMYGPAGTGKTAFAHYVASSLNAPLLVRRASDLLNPYVGQSEVRIAKMFREAEAEHAVLLLDEVDSMLRSRAKAFRSWEVTSVNELLQQMEAFSGVFLCATNLVDDIDRAAMRRFAFKVEFRPTTPAQRLALVERSLKQLNQDPSGELNAALVAQVRALDGATLGDFAAVVRKARLLGGELSVEQFIEYLRDETSYRPEAQRRPVGFHFPRGG